MAGYENLYWSSHDGPRLHARDYPGDGAQLPLICLPGLTRNARDYHEFAVAQAGSRRVIAVSFRGRGESAYAKDPMSYVPHTYMQDLDVLLTEQNIARFVSVGTSLGGVVAMLFAATHPARVAGAVLNDVGPEIEAAGLHRIRGQVGRGSSCPTWLHAARTLQDANRDVYPHWALEDWLGMAKRLYRLTGAGRVVLDYDLRIAEPFRVPGAEAAPDMWAALDGLGNTPVLVVRGARSDVLGQETAERMVERLPSAELVSVPGVGHAPTLAEPEVADAMRRLFARVERGA